MYALNVLHVDMSYFMCVVFFAFCLMECFWVLSTCFFGLYFNRNLQTQNEVSTHFYNGTVNALWIYYNHYSRPAGTGYDVTRFSVRAKFGVFNASNTNQPFQFVPEVRFYNEMSFVFCWQLSSFLKIINVNTFVLWANPSSPDIGFALHSPNGLDISSCYPPTEVKTNNNYCFKIFIMFISQLFSMMDRRR
jgi:hypothetical protein